VAYIDITYQRDIATGQIIFDSNGYPVYDANGGANTYNQLQDRIANEVLGSPTTTDIQNAISDAILEYERESFDFNQMRYFGDVTGSGSDLATVQGKEFYSNADLPALVNFPHISKILVLAFANRYPLISRSPQWIDDQSISTTWQGLPTDWCWQAGALRLYPVPDGNYPLIINATIRFAPLVNPTDFSPWTNRAERLIRVEAKRLLFRDIIRDADQVAAMETELMGNPGLGRRGILAMLRGEAMRRGQGSGSIRPSRGHMS
jgi:hypothetical protein